MWRDNEDNVDALIIMRRSFHTLKGGGRLIGAEIVGEYAWQLENILNKVIDKSLAATSDLHDLLENAVALINELIFQLKTDHKPVADVVGLFFSAHNFLENNKDSSQEISQPILEEIDTDLVDTIATNIEVVNHDVDEQEKPQHQEEIVEDMQKNALSENNLDNELYELFLEEAKHHVESIEKILESKKAHKILPIDETLLHALHTLFGCSRTAQVDAVAKLIGPLDKYCQECKQHHVKLKAEQFDVFIECIAYIKQNIINNAESLRQSAVNTELLQKVNNLSNVEIPVLEDIVASSQNDINAEQKIESELEPEIQPENKSKEAEKITLSDTNIYANNLSENVDHYEGKDADLVEIFLEEANDILETCNQCLEKWRVNYKDETAVLEFRRQMHTLKGSARMATYSNIGDFSHAFETFVIDIAESRIETSDEIFTVVQRCLDLIHEMVDTAVAKEPVYPATIVIDELEALRAGKEHHDKLPSEAKLEKTELHEEAVEPNIQQDQEEVLFISQPELAKDKKTNNDNKVKIPVLRNPVELSAQTNSQPVISGQQAVRLQSSMLDNLVNSAGMVNIFQARLEQVGNNYSVNIFELEQVVDRLRNQLRNLEIETETQILSRHAHEAHNQDDFDPLELDRYSNIQQLSRSLAESVNDLLSIKDILSDQVRDSEVLLSQQRRVSGDLQEGLMRTRMVRFNQLMPRLQRIVRQTTSELNKDADLKMIGQNTEVDSSILNRIVAPLEHLVRNAISHGIEEAAQRESANKPKQGEIKISVIREGSEIEIVVSDDGAGLDVEKIKNKAKELGLINDTELPEREVLNLILAPGFSTAEKVSQVSGRGVGMDVVASELKQLGGSLQIDSVFGKGAEFVIRIPITLAITQSLLIKCGNEIYAVPLASVEGVVRLSAHELKQKYAEKHASYHYADRDYRLCHLGKLLDVFQPQLGGADKMFPVLLVRSGDSRMAIHVEGTLGNRGIVVKPLASQLSLLPVVSGATILGDGKVVLI
ncbi:MAG: Hpt domain-containing protein, partial [Gammaproteobacteria bacterium]